MGKCEKLLEKAKSSPHNFRFDELCRLAECFGWIFNRQGGTSHRLYFNPGFPGPDGATMNFQNRNGKAKPHQIKQLLDAIERLGE